MNDTPLPQPLGIPKDVLTDLVETNARLLNAPDLPDAAVTAVGEWERWVQYVRLNHVRREHPVACCRKDGQNWPCDVVMGLNRAEAAAPALRAQGAATERARLAPIIREMWGHPTGEMIANAIEAGQL